MPGMRGREVRNAPAYIRGLNDFSSQVHLSAGFWFSLSVSRACVSMSLSLPLTIRHVSVPSALPRGNAATIHGTGAGHDLRGATHYLGTRIRELHYALQCLIDYKGFRMTAQVRTQPPPRNFVHLRYTRGTKYGAGEPSCIVMWCCRAPELRLRPRAARWYRARRAERVLSTPVWMKTQAHQPGQTHAPLNRFRA